MQYGVNLGEFVQTIDPIGQFHILKFLMLPTMLQACSKQCILDVAAVMMCISWSYYEPLVGFLAVLQCVPEGGNSIPLTPHGFQGMGTVDCPMLTHYNTLLLSAGADAPIVIDMGVSTSLTPDLSDFVTPLEPVQSAKVNGLMGKTKVVRKGLIETQKQVLYTKTNNVSSCDAPLCFACQIAKQSCCTPATCSTSHLEPMILCEGNLMPGSCVSMDQYISATPGHLPNMKGKEKKELKYNGGTIFVDHVSSHIYLKHQVSLTAGETL